MTNQPSDEDILIEAARAERKQYRSGASMFGMLGVAGAFGATGGVLIFGSHLVTRFLAGPFSLLGGFSMPIFTTLGIVALGIAAFFLLAAFVSSPLAAWGDRLPSDCPTCGQSGLRAGTVSGRTGDTGNGPRGVVTLCEAPGCSYAAARVTRASDSGSAE